MFASVLLVCLGGCDDGCVRNSDCATGHTCTDAVCTLKITADSGSDAANDDAGE